MTCVLLLLCLTSAQTRPVFCSLAVGKSDVVSEVSKEPKLAWPGLGCGPLRLKLS